MIFVFWTALATLSAVNQLVDPRGFGPRFMSPAGGIAMAYVECWLWAAITPPIFSLSSRLTETHSRWFVRIPILLLAGIAVSLIIYSFLGYARSEIFEVPRRGATGFAPLREIGRFRFANQFLVYCAVVAAGFAREYFLRDQERYREASVLQAQLAEARLDALRAQINPHFLFNTLNAIAALVERDPAGVRRMIARLADLLRRTIDSRGAATVPLSEEIDFLRRYIEIMEVRFQGRLRVRMDISPDTLDVRVPSLILQPIMERRGIGLSTFFNVAIEHGAGRAVGEGVIEVAARRDHGSLVLSVRDNGPGVGRAEAGVGLSNTRARLEQLYGSRASVSLESLPEGGAIATMTIPIDG